MNEKDKRYEELTNMVISDKHYNDWRRYQYQNRARVPLGNGSAIRDKMIEIMSEFLVSRGEGIN